MSQFALDGPLPSGTTVIESSAGTGKTYAIAGLAARYVVEGIPIDELLLVSFTQLASGELRERVRERLGSVSRGLRAALAGAGATAEDAVVELLRGRGPEALAAGCERIDRALGDFDAATIVTTHSFCQEVLGRLGVLADLEPEAEFSEDLSDLLTETIDDLWLRTFWREVEPEIPLVQARAIVRAAARNPGTPLVEGRDGLAERRVRMARNVCAEFERRKRRQGAMSYDDLLTRLHAVLGGPDGAAIGARLREAYAVVLVDEFQDTDPLQWAILERAFGAGATTLVLVADPKQAIYAFRGADVYAYLAALGRADTTFELGVNWRSDQGLLDAYDALLDGAQLGHPGIAYRRTVAAPAGAHRRLHGAPHPEPLRFRIVPRAQAGTTPGGYAQTGLARDWVALDLAGDIVELLDAGAEIECAAPERRGEREPVSPAHLAVLVRTNRQAATVREALVAAGVPAVTGGTGSVLGSPAATHWLRLLDALELPQARVRAHTAALTPFLGWDADHLAAAGAAELDALHLRLHDWAAILRDQGVASLMAAISAAERLPERVLARTDGERAMTDLRHVSELLHRARLEGGLGPAALAGWLRRRRDEEDRENADEERSRRLDSDADAVQVLTIHRSKGLEFPVVFLPFLWDARERRPPAPEPVAFHDPAHGEARRLDVTLAGTSYRAHVAQAAAEARGEDLRLLYVALTRARHQAIVWWAGSWGAPNSALSRLLFARAPDGTIGARAPHTPDSDATERLREVAALAPAGSIAVETARPDAARRWAPPVEPAADLRLAELTRGLDRRWRRTSYSDITAGAHELGAVASEPEIAGVGDEPAGVEPAAAAPAPAPEAELPLAEMAAGAEVGTLVHGVLEATDFTAADLRAELRSRLDAARRVRAVELGDLALVVEGLAGALETPLADFALRDVAGADRLDELEFELPLAGGDAPVGAVSLSAVASVLRVSLPEGDPLAGYAARLDDPALRDGVRGYLTGFLDLVVRRPGPRFHIVDYKTNWLAGPDESLRAWHYRPGALREEMQRRHYGLQALFYTVALHRYLRWRLPAYEPGRHLGAVHYAFLRGMTGAAGAGVFSWQPPPALVMALSDTLDQGATG